MFMLLLTALSKYLKTLYHINVDYGLYTLYEFDCKKKPVGYLDQQITNIFKVLRSKFSQQEYFKFLSVAKILRLEVE